MTVKSDLQKAIASCEQLKGSYAVMGDATEDETTKQTFEMMKNELEKHLHFLRNRLDYLNLNNPLNQDHVNNQQHPKGLEP